MKQLIQKSMAYEDTDFWLQSHNYFEHSLIILLLDNCVIHKNNKVVVFIQNTNFITLYNSDYRQDY